MIAAALFGLLLLAAGEYARADVLADEPRVAQALVGAGIAILYATAYGSWYLYGQIGGRTASVLMLLISAAALGLSLRHGPATAVMGMVGGFLTPWLAGDPEGGALPILAYIALLNAAIFVLAWKRGWGWLAAGAVVLSFVWTGFLIFGSPPDALAAGLFVVALASAASLLRSGAGPAAGDRAAAHHRPRRAGGAGDPARYRSPRLAALRIARGGSASGSAPGAKRPGSRRPSGLCSPCFCFWSRRRSIATRWCRGWPWRSTLMFAGVSIPLSTKDRVLRTLTACGALAGPILILRLLRPELLSPLGWGLAAAALAAAALALLWLHRKDSAGGKLPDSAMVAAGATAALLLALAGYDLTARDFVSATWLVLALALVAAGIRFPDKALRLAGLILLTATILKVFLLDAAELKGVLRILSFLGLGIALIGMGKLYGTVLRAERKVRETG